MKADTTPGALLKEMVQDIPVITSDAFSEGYGLLKEWVSSQLESLSGAAGSGKSVAVEGGISFSSENGRNESNWVAEDREFGGNIDEIIAVSNASYVAGHVGKASALPELIKAIDFGVDGFRVGADLNASDLHDQSEFAYPDTDSLISRRVYYDSRGRKRVEETWRPTQSNLDSFKLKK